MPGPNVLVNVLIQLFLEILQYTYFLHIMYVYIIYLVLLEKMHSRHFNYSGTSFLKMFVCSGLYRFCFCKKNGPVKGTSSPLCAFTPLRLIWPCVRPVFRRTGLISNPSLLVNSFPAVAYDAEVFNDVGCLKSRLHCKLHNHPTKLVRILVGIQGFQRISKVQKQKHVSILYWVFKSRVFLQCLQLPVNIWI